MDGTRLLVVDDEQIVRESLSTWLREEGFEADCVAAGREALEMAQAHSYSAVLLDIRMPGIDGIQTLRELHRLIPSLPVIMMTAYADVSTAVEAMKEGAQDYVTKPFDPDEICMVVRQVVSRREASEALVADVTPGRESWGYEDFSGNSSSMAQAIELARKAAETNIPILLQGERGLGKECLARAIHGSGRRRFEAFVAVHCEGINEGVLEAELFGYEKGALPLHQIARKGRLEMADHGTIYLDEVGGLSHRLQVALLDTVEDRAVVRLGGEQQRPIDIRLVSASSRDLERAAADRIFLPELYNLLSGTIIRIPPLRERREDIAPLACRLLRQSCKELGKEVEDFFPAALKKIEHQQWPGNIRELARAIERAIVACPGKTIRPEDLMVGQ